MTTYSWSSPAFTRPALPEEEPDIYDRDLLGADECCEHLLELLIELKRKHVPLSAKHVCCIAFWAEGAGAKGCSRLAMRPDSTKFSRKFDTGTGTDLKAGLYDVSVPGHFRGDHSRMLYTIPGRPVHEAFADELAESPDLPDLLAKAKARNLLPPSYYNHPCNKERPRRHASLSWGIVLRWRQVQ